MKARHKQTRSRDISARLEEVGKLGVDRMGAMGATLGIVAL